MSLASNTIISRAEILRVSKSWIQNGWSFQNSAVVGRRYDISLTHGVASLSYHFSPSVEIAVCLVEVYLGEFIRLFTAKSTLELV